MVSHKTSSVYPHTSSENLSVLVRTLFDQQRGDWPMLADGVDALSSVQFRTLDFPGYAVRLQYNPKRIVSTGAKVDAQSIRERKCFLCVHHLPPEQRGVLYREKFLILCNPMPIFREHFTISHIDHIPQSIEEHIVAFLELARDLSGTHSVFYNGPRCGASAPDHMHFQASPAGSIPVEHDAADTGRRRNHSTRGTVSIASLADYGRGVIVLESASMHDLEMVFLRLTGALRKMAGSDDEPMMNVIGSYRNPAWRVIIFPRTKHRPEAYFKEGDEKILISPAAVDIGGLIVTPAEKDFRTVDAECVSRIFQEVSVGEEFIHSLITAL